MLGNEKGLLNCYGMFSRLDRRRKDEKGGVVHKSGRYTEYVKRSY